MHAVLFEVKIKEGQKDAYLDRAVALRQQLEHTPGFISIERFQSLTEPDKLFSLSYWEDEEAIKTWKKMQDHAQAQADGRHFIFEDYRICVVHVERDYTLETSSFKD